MMCGGRAGRHHHRESPFDSFESIDFTGGCDLCCCVFGCPASMGGYQVRTDSRDHLDCIVDCSPSAIFLILIFLVLSIL